MTFIDTLYRLDDAHIAMDAFLSAHDVSVRPRSLSIDTKISIDYSKPKGSAHTQLVFQKNLDTITKLMTKLYKILSTDFPHWDIRFAYGSEQTAIVSLDGHMVFAQKLTERGFNAYDRAKALFGNTTAEDPKWIVSFDTGKHNFDHRHIIRADTKETLFARMAHLKPTLKPVFVGTLTPKKEDTPTYKPYPAASAGLRILETLVETFSWPWPIEVELTIIVKQEAVIVKSTFMPELPLDKKELDAAQAYWNKVVDSLKIFGDILAAGNPAQPIELNAIILRDGLSITPWVGNDCLEDLRYMKETLDKLFGHPIKPWLIGEHDDMTIVEAGTAQAAADAWNREKSRAYTDLYTITPLSYLEVKSYR